MIFLSAILVAISIAYFLTQFSFAKSWDKLDHIEWNDTIDFPKVVSILVPARNEAEQILTCLACLLDQAYLAAYEVICLDNHSEDDTAVIASEIDDDRLRVIALDDVLPKDTTFKKEAIAYGVSEAQGECIFILDADCTVGPEWLETMVTHLLQRPCEYVAGPVQLTDSSAHWLTGFEQIEFSGLQVVTGGGLKSGLLLSSNGANHGFRKSSFRKVDGYRGNDHIRSGDDLFLLHKLVNAGATYTYAKDRKAIARTITQPSLRAFVAQRRRWAGKSADLGHLKTKVISLLALCTALAVVVAVVLAMFSPSHWWLALVVLSLKLAGDTLVLNRGAHFFEQKQSPAQLVLAHCIQPLYIIWVGFKSLRPGSQSWKGRRV